MASIMTRRADRFVSPFAEFDELIRRAFPARPAGTPLRTAAPTALRPAAEITREGDDAVVTLELPGLDFATDIDVELHDGTLVISGERRERRAIPAEVTADAAEGENDTDDARADQGESAPLLREIRYGAFRRAFSLPEHVTADAVSATYDAGLLAVRVAGVYQSTEPQKIAVTGK